MAASGSDYRTFAIESVIDGTPAAASDLQNGDRIVAIDGRDAGTYALWQLEKVLSKTGATVSLTIRRGDRTVVKTLELHALV